MTSPKVETQDTSSLISEMSIGMSYEMTVLYIGMAMVDEKKGEPLYGGNLRVECSHKSGVIHVSVVTGTSSRFWGWLKNHEDLLTTECANGWKLKSRIAKAVSVKVQRAYIKWTMLGCPSGKD